MVMRELLGASLIVLLLLLDDALSFSASSVTRRSSLRMDTERLENSMYVRNILNKNTNNKVLTIPPPPPTCPIQQAEAEHGMPWRTSIDPSHKSDNLLYMPFWEWQLDFMKRHLNHLTLRPATNLDGTMDFSIKENHAEKARIVNLCFESDEYRKIRMTYYDAGHKTQVFNSLWYPRSNLPILGIDLLAFYQKKHLAVVDFQPLHQEEEHHDLPYSHLQQPIQSQYPSLQGKMSKRFYDETQFFSEHMLFARFEDENVVHQDLQPAFQQYVSTHVDLVKSASTKTAQTPWSRHAAYDAYSAKRDPATAMFERMFGKEWSDAYVHEFLFSMSGEHQNNDDQ